MEGLLCLPAMLCLSCQDASKIRVVTCMDAGFGLKPPQYVSYSGQDSMHTMFSHLYSCVLVCTRAQCLHPFCRQGS